MSLHQSILLGIVQGLTEFLPVSSSGHLVIFERILGIPSNIAFDVTVHIATLLAVCIFFWKDIIFLIKAFFLGFWQIIVKRIPPRSIYYSNTNFKIACLVIIASIPTALLGFIFKDYFEKAFHSLLAVGSFLILTGILILLAEWLSKANRKTVQISFLDALITGTAQGCAIAPGLSRSGATISAALLCNFERSFAAKFSFLLSIPAILGAALFELKDLKGMDFNSLALGFIAAVITGYFAIKVFMDLIQKTRIRGFAYYCLALGIASMIWSIL